MVRRNHPLVGIGVALAFAAMVGTYCANQGGSPVSSGTAEDEALVKAFAVYDAQSAMAYGGMGSVIDLSTDQKQRIKTILEKYRPRTKSGFDGNRPTREEWMAMRDSMKTRRDSIKTEIESVLTFDQKALLEQIRTQLKSGVVPDTLIKKRIARLTTFLTLTPDQKTQGFALLKQEMQKRLDSWHKDSLSTDGSRHSWGMRRTGIGKRLHGQSGLPVEFMNILTDSQKQLLQRTHSRKDCTDSTKCGFHGKTGK